MTYNECKAQLNILFSILHYFDYTDGYFAYINNTTRLVVYKANDPEEHVGCITNSEDTKYFVLYEELIKAAIEAKKQNDI